MKHANNNGKNSLNESDINTLAGMIREYVATNCYGVDEGLEVLHRGYMAFIYYRADANGESITVTDVWDKGGKEHPEIAEALQLLVD